MGYSKKDKFNIAIWAYLAGLIDGEGCLTISHSCYPYDRPGKHYQLRLYVGNTNVDAMIWLKETFGGRVNSHQPKNKKWKTLYSWITIGKKADFILGHVLPFLIIKNKQANLALDFQHLLNCRYLSCRGRKSYTIRETTKVERIINEMHKLNRRGNLCENKNRSIP